MRILNKDVTFSYKTIYNKIEGSINELKRYETVKITKQVTNEKPFSMTNVQKLVKVELITTDEK